MLAEDRQQMKDELTNILAELNGLTDWQKMQSMDSADWVIRSEMLEAKLKGALQKLESSETTVVELQETVASLRSELDVLKMQYESALRCWKRERRMRQVWEGVAVTAVVIAGVTYARYRLK